MPDVIIKGMEMPKVCAECRLCGLQKTSKGDKLYCQIMKAAIGMEFGMTSCPDRCPLRPAPEWISVGERLPEDGQICLVCGKKCGMNVARAFLPSATGHWTGDPKTCWWTITGTGKYKSVTHWMPLPGLPAEKEADQCRK